MWAPERLEELGTVGAGRLPIPGDRGVELCCGTDKRFGVVVVKAPRSLQVPRTGNAGS